LIKVTIPDQLLAEWFTKSLLPLISRDITMGGVVTEEKAISQAQYLDLVYSQYGTLYELIPNATHTPTDPSKPSSMAHADGVICTVKTQSTSQSTRTVNHSISTPVTSLTSLSSTFLPTQISEVNIVQSASSQQPESKKKIKNKPKKTNNNNEHTKTQTPPHAVENPSQRKPKFPCLIFGEDHFTRDCPHRDEVAKIFKGNSQPTMLTQPFSQ
jgi:hypothetical protein